jgi:hypothetical protein
MYWAQDGSLATILEAGSRIFARLTNAKHTGAGNLAPLAQFGEVVFSPPWFPSNYI